MTETDVSLLKKIVGVVEDLHSLAESITKSNEKGINKEKTYSSEDEHLMNEFINLADEFIVAKRCGNCGHLSF